MRLVIEDRPKNECGLLTYLGGSPKPRQDVDQQPCNSCSSTVRLALTPFPRKSQRLLLNLARGCLPQSFHSLQSPSMTRFTQLSNPSCSAFSFSNDRASFCELFTCSITSPSFRENSQLSQGWSNPERLSVVHMRRACRKFPYISSTDRVLDRTIIAR